jgi:hypothetical protein
MSTLLVAGSEAPVRILYISRGGAWYQTMGQDPAIQTFWLPVPGHSHIELLGQDPGVLHKIMRIYMPRRVEDLLSEYNMVILQECPYGSTAYDSLWFKDSWVKMIADAVEIYGMSLEMWGGDASWGGGGEGFYTSWGDTILGPLLPVECLGGYNYQFATPQDVEFADWGHPLARLPWGSCPPVELNNAVKMREGANLIAEVVYGDTAWPFIFDWEYGEGFVVGETQVVHSRGTLNLMIAFWEYHSDYITYLAYHGARRSIPEDIVLVKRVRNQIQDHHSHRAMVISVFDFAEKFGADVSEAYGGVEEIELLYTDVEELFIEGSYEAASDILENIQLLWKKTLADAMRLKDRAMFWVYLSEYLVISGASLICGTILWSLMVRRRLYREVSTTTLA